MQQTEDLASLPFPNIRTKWTEKLEMFNTDNYDPLPVYRVLSPDGTVIDLAHEPKVGICFHWILIVSSYCFLSCNH